LPKKEYKITIDKKPFDRHDQFITGNQIKELVYVDMTWGVWLKVHGPGKDKPIGNDEKVDLSQPGTEHFFTGPISTTEGGNVIFTSRR